jgi:hypothetical protein
MRAYLTDRGRGLTGSCSARGALSIAGRGTKAIVGSRGGATGTRADRRAVRAVRRRVDGAARSGGDLSSAGGARGPAPGRLRRRRKRQAARGARCGTARQGGGGGVSERHDGAADRAADLVRAKRLLDRRLSSAMPPRHARRARLRASPRPAGAADRGPQPADHARRPRRGEGAARRAPAGVAAARPRGSAACVARPARADDVGARTALRCTSTAHGCGSAGRSTGGR